MKKKKHADETTYRLEVQVSGNELICKIIILPDQPHMSPFDGSEVVRRFPLTADKWKSLEVRARKFGVTPERYMLGIAVLEGERTGTLYGVDDPMLLELAHRIKLSRGVAHL